MKITDGGGIKPPELQNTEYVKDRGAVRGEREDAYRDQVTLSEKAREIRRLQLEVSKLPDVRPERVERVKNALQNGTYKIKPEVVAEKLLEEVFFYSRRV